MDAREALPRWTGTLAAYGALVYLLVYAVCTVVLFGYEEQWVGPDAAFYTLASMNPVEQVAYLVWRFVLPFPAWPPARAGDSFLTPLVPMASGALVGGVAGWILDRRERAAARSMTDPA